MANAHAYETEMGLPFVINDCGVWLVVRNEDHLSRDGHWGLRTIWLCDRDGYETEAEARAALEAYMEGYIE